jgi:hypothetical protein
LLSAAFVQPSMVASAILHATPAPASARMVTFIGAGLASCGTWTADHRLGDVVADEQWVVGFLSGMGYSAVADPLGGTDFAGVIAWIGNYCAANPLDSILKAAGAFARAHPGPAAQ